jgi:hypothetical protein
MLDLRDRPLAQLAALFLGLICWAGIYALWVRGISGISVEGEALQRIVFGLQSTLYVSLSVLVLLPLILAPIHWGVRAIGMIVALMLMVLHFLWRDEGVAVHLFRDLSLVTSAVILGGLLGWKVAENRHILPAFIVLAVIDVWSVFFGLSKMLIQSPEVSRHVIVGSPVVGYPAPGIPLIRPLVGPVDILILVACIAMTIKFQFGLARSLGYLAGGLLAGFLVTGFLGQPLPMLPFLVSAFVLAHYRKLRLDARQVLIAAGFSIAIILMLTVMVSPEGSRPKASDVPEARPAGEAGP